MGGLVYRFVTQRTPYNAIFRIFDNGSAQTGKPEAVIHVRLIEIHEVIPSMVATTV